MRYLSASDQPLGSTRTLLKENADGGPSGATASTVRRTVLPGGLRVITETMPGARSATLGLWTKVGSRDESRSLSGATHFLEHLLFKGTKRRTALDISAELDAVGGELNAFTGKEYTCYHARVLDADVPLAIDVICDMVASSLIPEHEVGRRAQRDPRRDRHARRRPRRRGARRVRRDAVRRLDAARPLHHGHRRLDQRAHPTSDHRLLRPSLHRRQPCLRRRWCGRPQPRRQARAQGLRAGRRAR